jgi:hypothetical protein
MRTFLSSWISVQFLAGLAFAQSDSGEARQTAELYLEAASNPADESEKALLLAGASSDAELFTLENWRILSGDPVRSEEGDLAEAERRMAALDRAKNSALAQLRKGKGGGAMEVTQLGKKQVEHVMAHTEQEAREFIKAHPLRSYVMRVGKEVYWSPKNPPRKMLAEAGKGGRYSLEVHRYKIETREGAQQVPRLWALKLLRFHSANLDTGWKVLPAADWSTE